VAAIMADIIASALELDGSGMGGRLGGAALHANPVEPADFANAFLSLQNKMTRNELIRKGFENSRRFDRSKMTLAYLDLHLSTS